MRADSLQRDKSSAVGAPHRRRRDLDIGGHARARERAANAAEVVAVEKVGLAALADLEDQLPGPACVRDVERGRRGSAEVEVVTIEVAPVCRGEKVAGFVRGSEIGPEAQHGFAVAPLACAKRVAGRREQRLSITADAALPPYAAASRARFEARGLPRLASGKADNEPVIGAAVAPVP